MIKENGKVIKFPTGLAVLVGNYAYQVQLDQIKLAESMVGQAATITVNSDKDSCRIIVEMPWQLRNDNEEFYIEGPQWEDCANILHLGPFPKNPEGYVSIERAKLITAILNNTDEGKRAVLATDFLDALQDAGVVIEHSEDADEHVELIKKIQNLVGAQTR